MKLWAMKEFTEGRPYEIDHLVRNYPWESLGSTTVVDVGCLTFAQERHIDALQVGGSNSFVSIALAEAYPNLSLIVQDLPSVVIDLEPTLPAAVRPRVKFMAYDFLTEQSVKDADVYLFRWIFHNWSDKYTATIIRILISALKPGARVVIMDNVLPEPGILTNAIESRLRSMDLTMTEMQNARERKLEERGSLFESTDSRFKFQGGSKPNGSNL